MGLDIFAPKAPPVLGVDFSSSSIKMVELVKDKRGISLARYAVEPLAAQVISDGAVKDANALSAALQACHKRLGSKVKGVATALPASMVVMKTVRVDKALNEVEIEDQITSDLSNHLPYAIDEDSDTTTVRQPQELWIKPSTVVNFDFYVASQAQITSVLGVASTSPSG